MNIKKQANLLGFALDLGVISGERVVSWSDQLIANSVKAEPWMIEISMHNPSDTTGLVSLLGMFSGFEFNGSFVEYIALVGCLTTLKNASPFTYYPDLAVNKDNISIDQNDQESKNAVASLIELENCLEAASFNEESVNFSNERLMFLVKKAQAVNPEIEAFLRGNTA